MAGPEFPSCQPLPQLLTGGYDDDYFVDPAPESLHCPVCLLVLREPHLISCCGAHLCQVCIERVQANEQSCPCCRSERYMHMLNKEKRGKVLELRVRCINSVKGCEWVGELGDQDRHCTSRCQYVEAVCQYGCGESYPRFMLGKHEQDECPERPIDMKMATFTRQMMEKVSSLETKYEGEITALKQKLEDQEERHIMEKKELQRNYEEGKKEMQHEFEVQTEEMKKKAKTDKEQIVQIMKKEQEKQTQQAEEMKKKAEADKEQMLQIMKEEQEKQTQQAEQMKKKSETDKKQIQVIKKEQEKCEAERRGLANKLEKQREEYELEKREMKKMKKENKEDLQHQFDMLQKITEKDKKEVLLQLAVHNNCDKDMREKLIVLQRSAETLKNQVEQCENGRKALEKKLENEKQQIQEKQRVQKQMTDQYEAEAVAFKMQQPREISQLKKEISDIQVVSNKSPDVLLLMSKLRQIPGLVYHPEEGRVEVTAATQEERERCISIFQQAYQQIVNNRQFKSESLELSQPYPPEQMEKLLQEFNEKYHQCYFSYNGTSHSIKIVSMSSRQYDQAKKLIKEKQSGKLPTSSASSQEVDGSDKKPIGKPGCPLCLNEALTDPVVTNCCKNQFCKACIEQAMVHSPYCPTCKTPLRTVEGNQPLGSTMNHYTSRSSLPGYPNCGTITISYFVPGGTQGPEHPNPGHRYQGTSRTAYLPDNPEGREVLNLLQKAFHARLIFTVGTSTTSGRSNTVVWNDIHHKTNTHGGSSGYGYPDPTYLQRVKEELNAKGIH